MSDPAIRGGSKSNAAPGLGGAREQGQVAQRVKVGLIGLAVVVLLILIAGAIMRTATREAPIAAAGAPKADLVANLAIVNQQRDMAEPLAELGVDPMNQQAAARPAR